MRPLILALLVILTPSCNLVEVVSNPDASGIDTTQVGQDTFDNLDTTQDTTTTQDTFVSGGDTTDTSTPTDTQMAMDTVSDTGSDTTDTVDPPDPGGPTRYPAGRIHSPISPHVADNLRMIATRGSGLQNDVFMKVGASSTISTNFMNCYAGNNVDFDGRTDLDTSHAFFLAGDAAGDTPFDRRTRAARSGRSAVWAISDDGSGQTPIEQEVAAISPRYAIVAYGTNDMQLGVTFQSAMWNFANNIFTLTDELIDQGIVPILMNVPPRTDAAGAMDWVPSYNAVILGLAQSRQIPLFDFYEVAFPMPNFGLSNDELHGTVFSGGPCVFTQEGLGSRMNQRNLETLVAFDRVKAAVVDGVDQLDPTIPLIEGQGTPASPFLMEGMPFTDVRDTRDSTTDQIDAYSGCNASQNESGPEFMYHLSLTQETRIRAMVFDQGNVDIDIHLLSGFSASGSDCLERDHQIIQRTLPAGDYTFVLDTFVSSNGTERSGEFLFAVHICTDGDPDCD